MRSISRLWLKLRGKAYREEFVAAQARRVIPFQIRALMKAKKISQQELAERSGLTQGVISRAANPAYGKLTLNTIIRVAAGFDVAFIGLFVPFSRLEYFFETLSEERLAKVATFEEEDAAIQDDSLPPLPEGTSFQDALRAFLGTAAPPTNIGRSDLPSRKRKAQKGKRAKKR